MVDIWQDDSPRKCIQKCTQMAVSTTAMLQAAHRAYFKKRNQIYFFPTDDSVSDFVQGKFNPLVADNPALQAFIQKTDNVGLKKIGNAFLYFRGMKSKSKLISISGDDLTFDEINFYPSIKDVELAEKRASDAINPTITYMSHPTIPNYGISELFDISDQKERVMKCPHCSTWNAPSELKFPDCIEPGYYACKRCRLALDVYESEWVPKFPDRFKTMSGWWIPRLISPKANYSKILELYNNATDIQNFFNTELGLPYADSDSRITYGEVMALCGNYTMPENSSGNTIGVDVGNVLHCVVSGPSKTAGKLRDYIWIGELKGDGMEKWDELFKLCRRLGVKRGMIDYKPDMSASKDFCTKMGKGFWVNNYIEAAHEATWNEETQTMQINRTESLDRSHKLFKYKFVQLPSRQYPILDVFANHCKNIARQMQINEKTRNIEYRWVETGPDHFRHAMNYDSMLWYTGEGMRKAVVTTHVPTNIREMMES